MTFTLRRLSGARAGLAEPHPAVGADLSTQSTRPAIARIQPPEKDFFSKSLSFHGIPIKAHDVVAAEAMYAAYDRLTLIQPERRGSEGQSESRRPLAHPVTGLRI
jgi:hypothetical protein